jgi:hypothetical protein
VTNGPIALAIDFGALLDHLGITYALGGSVGATFFGEPRTTIDVDFAVRLSASELEVLLQHTEAEFYVPTDSARRAVAALDSFNLIHNSGLKIDLFVTGTEILDTQQLARRLRIVARREPFAELWVTSPEDQILRKLDWFRQGGEVSDRQWRDILGLINTQRQYLDFEYLTFTSGLVGLDQLLTRALGLPS